MSIAKFLDNLVGYILVIICLLLWMMGVAIAKGFWSTFIAIILPFYSWYLVVEAWLYRFNILN